VCPWNKFARAARANQALAPRAELAAPALADLLALDDAAFRQIFAGSPVKRIGRVRMARNAAICAGNSGMAALAGPVAALLDDADPVVRGAAIWALFRLDPARFAAARAARLDREADAEVRAEWLSA
jgi:epoxyqueuosine reductase